MIRDLYDNSIAAYKTGTWQTVNLVLNTIRLAMKQAKKRGVAELQLHSAQGFPYTSQAYFNLTQAYGITPSMSRKGNPYDNAMAENFFSILKTECIYRHKFATFSSEANEMIDRYILSDNHQPRAHPANHNHRPCRRFAQAPLGHVPGRAYRPIEQSGNRADFPGMPLKGLFYLPSFTG